MGKLRKMGKWETEMGIRNLLTVFFFTAHGTSLGEGAACPGLMMLRTLVTCRDERNTRGAGGTLLPVSTEKSEN